MNTRTFNNYAIRIQRRGEQTWFCLTDMAKASFFNKKANDHLEYLDDERTKTLIEHLETSFGFPVWSVTIGGDYSGTWVIEEVALDFACKCSVHFQVWMLQTIKQLLVETNTKPVKEHSLDLSRDLSLLDQVYGNVVKPEVLANVKGNYIKRNIPSLAPEVNQISELI